MNTTTTKRSSSAPGGLSPAVRRAIPVAVVVVLLIAMGLDTKYVPIGSSIGAGPEAFDPATYGQSEYPKVKAAVEQRAVDAPTLAAAIAQDQAAAGKQYGVKGGISPEMAVKFTGIVGEGKSGIFNVAVDGVENVTIRVQTGPAINGTSLRDGAGNIKFGDFTNQIEYQNAAAALNNEMKKEVLANIDRDNLSGKTVSVTGVFGLINPKNWLVTPVDFNVVSP